MGLVVLALAVRLYDLPTRGEWDADQGNQALAMLRWVRDGVVPLLGPLTSIGTFHHGALFYWLLAPAAFLTNADPLALVAEIAVAGALAVVPVWWLARTVSGPVAGFLAGLVLAVSASAIDESTFLWNPNLVALPAALALAFAWQAWRTRQARWWIGAAVAAAIVAQCHILGLTLPVALAGFFLADLARRPGPERGRVAMVGLVGLALVVLTFAPMIAYDLGHDFSELRGMVGFLTGATASASSVPLLTRVLIVSLRVVAWPLTGLVTNGPLAPLPAILAFALVVWLVVWRSAAGIGLERDTMRWLGLTLVFGTIVLILGAASLSTVVEDLPVDHYHAFLDPVVVLIVGVGLTAAFASARGRVPAALPLSAGLVMVIVGWNVAHWPPGVARDGGWPAADAAATRILGSVDASATIEMVSLPDFKLPDAYGFPLLRRGASVATLDAAATATAAQLVVLCDSTFREAIGADCGGPAEDRVARPSGLVLRDRFEAAPGRVISVYAAP